MSSVISNIRISSFVDVLKAYYAAGIDLHNMIDGGAGCGLTAMDMLPFLKGNSKIYAFEPFSGNHRFFDNLDPRIELIKKALSDKNTVSPFFVSSVVDEDSAWGKQGLTGYSSLGYCVDVCEDMDDERILHVDCIRGDDAIQNDVGFIKLDLQGGELKALKGMPHISSNAAFLWVEYLGMDFGLIKHLIDDGFYVFDTEYLFIGEPTREAKRHFNICKEGIQLSTGNFAWTGFKKGKWGDYFSEFTLYRSKFGMVQTDLLCVNSRRKAEFDVASHYL